MFSRVMKMPKIDKPKMRYCQVLIVNQMAVEIWVYMLRAPLVELFSAPALCYSDQGAIVRGVTERSFTVLLVYLQKKKSSYDQ